MDYDIRTSEDGTYIRIRVHKPVTSELGCRGGRSAAKLGGDTGIRCYLAGVRGAPNIEALLANYELAYKKMQGIGFPRTARLALLTDPDDKSHNFMETLFLNAGYIVRLFINENEAIAWLNQSSELFSSAARHQR